MIQQQVRLYAYELPDPIGQFDVWLVNEDDQLPGILKWGPNWFARRGTSQDFDLRVGGVIDLAGGATAADAFLLIAEKGATHNKFRERVVLNLTQEQFQSLAVHVSGNPDEPPEWLRTLVSLA